jgi:succinyl-CoA synthetase alpha subunit
LSTYVVGGVTPGKGFNSFRPSCFNTVKGAVEQAGADTIIFLYHQLLLLMLWKLLMQELKLL